MPKAKIGSNRRKRALPDGRLTKIEEVSLSTPFGDPSDAFIIGTLAGGAGRLPPRHGRGHTSCRLRYRSARTSTR